MLNKSTIIHLDDSKIDLFEYIDTNSNLLKKQYLEIVFNIGNLKINNIASEIEKVCNITNNIELLKNITDIPKLTMKYIVSTQSLYL